MIEFLYLPFTYGFMHIPFLVCAVIAVPTALLSCFLVLKGWSLMGDAVSHAVLPGVVLAYMIGAPLVIGAFAAAMVCALLTGYLSETSRIKRDTVMGVVFSGMFGLGIVLFVASNSDQHLDHILFGNVFGVDWDEFWTTAGFAIGVSLILIFKRKDLMLHAFDPAQARAQGINVTVLHYGLLTLLSLTIVSTLSAVGIILAIGLLIAPGAIAFLVTRSFGAMLVVAVLVTELAAIVGIWASVHLGSEPAPTVILVLLILFVLAFVRTLFQRRTAVA